MKQRLIDANELLKDKVSNAYISRFEIENAPTIDAEPVVKCKDCKYSVLQELYGVLRWCCKLEDLRQFVDENHYCGYGAKMDEEKKK